MPLLRGYSRETQGENIRRLMSEGYPQRQAVAISLSQARRSGGEARGVVAPRPNRAGRVLDVIPARHWVHRTGRTASVYGAVPWTGAPGNQESDWEMETVGWTWQNDDGTVGLGRVPAKTREEAVALMRKINDRLDRIREEAVAYTQRKARETRGVVPKRVSRSKPVEKRPRLASQWEIPPGQREVEARTSYVIRLGALEWAGSPLDTRTSNPNLAGTFGASDLAEASRVAAALGGEVETYASANARWEASRANRAGLGERAYEMTPEQRKYQPLFDLVANRENWKYPVDALVSPSVVRALGATKSDLGRAVTFYTGSVPTISREGVRWRVRAAGYYAAVGS